MRTLPAVFALALGACLRQAAPTSSPETAGAPIQAGSEVRPDDQRSRSFSACLPPEAEELLDPCAGRDRAASPLDRLAELEAERQWAKAAASLAEERWPECTERFDELAYRHPSQAKRVEAGQLALRCLDQVEELPAQAEKAPPARRRSDPLDDLETEEQDRLAPRALGPDEERQLELYERRLCLEPQSPDRAAILSRRARIYYERNRWEAAATLFRQVVDEHPESEVAPLAANLHLDCLNAISRIAPSRRAACRDALSAAVEAFRSNEALVRDEELRTQLDQLDRAIGWAQAEALLEQRRSSEAGERFLRIYRERSGEDRAGRVHGLDEVLYNAALAFETDYRVAAALEVRRRLIAEYGEGSAWAAAQGRPSHWAMLATYQLAANLHALGRYEEAAAGYEDFARRRPGEREAPQALSEAFGLRLGLRQGAAALADSRLFQKLYGARRQFASDTASLALLEGRAQLALGDRRAAEASFAQAIARFGRSACPDELIRALVAHGEVRREQAQAGDESYLAALARADEGAVASEAPAARLERLRALVRTDADEAEYRDLEDAARLTLLLEAIATARERLGQPAPERALLQGQAIGPALAEQLQVFHMPPGALPPGFDWPPLDPTPLDAAAFGDGE